MTHWIVIPENPNNRKAPEPEGPGYSPADAAGSCLTLNVGQETSETKYGEDIWICPSLGTCKN